MSMHSRIWQDRPTDVSNLLNPAFVGMSLRKAVDGYVKEQSIGMPFELSFLVLPFVLHQPTREQLPSTIATMMQTWLMDNREVLIGLPKRAKDLVPFAREGILFASLRKVLRFDESGLLCAGSRKLIKAPSFIADKLEVNEIFKKSEFFGRWVSQAGNSTTIFAMLGIRP